MEAVSDFIDTLTSTLTPPTHWVLYACLVAAAAVVLYQPVWRWVRNLVTIAHEGGHALTAVLTRRRLTGIRLHSDTSGLTFTKGRPTGPGAVLTAFFGYPAPALLGFGAAALIGGGHIVAFLWIAVLITAVMLVFIRNWFGALALVVVGGGAFAATWYGSAEVQIGAAYIAVFILLLGSVKAVFELAGQRRAARRTGNVASDADQLANLTRLPAGFWMFLFVLINGACTVYGLWLLLPEQEFWPTL
ncbi:M50 family metallopeptidase [Salininema proteolyticum]|uniref:M50 family metallopeptidase n=1 Tax=Salininema proteolyticum TaxID=1607685 RepID=A0ABV8U3J5_9ACTN